MTMNTPNAERRAYMTLEYEHAKLLISALETWNRRLRFIAVLLHRFDALFFSYLTRVIVLWFFLESSTPRYMKPVLLMYPYGQVDTPENRL